MDVKMGSFDAYDINELQSLPINLSKKAILLGDAAYTNYNFEDELWKNSEIKLLVKRRKNLKRQNSNEENFLLKSNRNYIETVFSSITSRMPRYIKARTEKGFCLKVMLFILAYMVNLYFPLS